jgi:hypothetical protein
VREVYGQVMRLSVILLVAVLGLAGSAHAKGLTGIEVCGESDCASAAMSGFDRPPLDDTSAGQLPPAVGPFYRIVFEVEGHREDAWRVYYEPRSGLGAVRTEWGSTMWLRFDDELAPIVKRLARRVAPFPTPPVQSVTIGGRAVEGDPRSYLQLFRAANRYDRPLSDDTVAIRIDSPLRNPWTEEALLRYYPEEDIVQLSPAAFVRLDADLAADVEAPRELGADGPGVPWAVVAGAVAAAALAVVAAAWLTRRPWVRVPPKPM